MQRGPARQRRLTGMEPRRIAAPRRLSALYPELIAMLLQPIAGREAVNGINPSWSATSPGRIAGQEAANAASPN